MKRLAIGVFDSGVGGISILEDLIKAFPNEDFLYLADTINLPYGTKTNQEIAEFVTMATDKLMLKRVKAIVIACNTATAHSAHLDLPVPVIGMISPTAEAAKQVTANNKILVLATNATAESHLYKKELAKSGIQADEVGCSEFVPLVESGLTGTEQAHAVVQNKLKPYANGNHDTVILGCTHFGYLRQEISAVLENRILVSGSGQVAAELEKALRTNNQFNKDNNSGSIYLASTGNQNDFIEIIKTIKPTFEFVVVDL